MKDILYIESMQTMHVGNSERNTYSTSAQTRIHELVAIDEKIIRNIKQTINSVCESLSSELMSDELEVEFSFGVTGEGNICILSGSSSMGIKVKMLWKKQEK